MSFYHWSPSKTAKREFAEKMQEIDEFCKEHNISHSSSSDSYYFTLNGKTYRVSNHTIAASDNGMYDDMGHQLRESYHPTGEAGYDVCITAGKTRIIDIYENIEKGIELDRRGYPKK